MEINIEMLADTIAERMKPAIPISVALWSVNDIVAWSGYSRSTVDNMTKRPDFPRAFRLPGLNGKGFPKWKASEVLTWAEQFRDREAAL